MSIPAWLPENKTTTPVAWRNWLFDRGSLTCKLTELAQGHFSVQVLSEGYDNLHPDERQLMGMSAPEQGWCREVLLLGKDQPWVYARSVINPTALNDPALGLRQLGAQPLGYVLFNTPNMQRSELQVCTYPHERLPATWQTETLFARRSCFSLQHSHVLVTEVFLPAFCQSSGLQHSE